MTVKYTDKDICNKIREIMDSLGLDRFPTYHEMQNYTGSTAFVQLVARRGGSKYFSDMMSVEWKNAYTFGTDFEAVAVEDIKTHTGMDVVFTQNQYPYDAVVGNGIKVDVKVAKPDTNGFHQFALHRKEPTCGLYMFYKLAEDGTILCRFIIPACVLRGQQKVTVGENSKWDVYKDRWDYFEQYAEFYDSLKKGVVACG